MAIVLEGKESKHMTFKCWVKDSSGNKISDAIVSVSVQETGQFFQRKTDGEGYGDLAVQNVPYYGKNVLISVIKEGFAVWSDYNVIQNEDKEVNIVLVPFV